jgi:membrane-bound lytic murein transglycosylase D
VTAPPPEGAASTLGEIPRSRLLDDKERMKSLISQVHGHGGEESPELADLLNEEAALVYEVMEQKCDQPGDKCERAVPVVAGTLATGAPQNQIHDLFEERKISARPAAAQGRPVPKWLAGLVLPAIGAEDDPGVKQWLEYYTEHQVGREVFQTMMFRCGAYQDLIAKTLVHYGLPQDLLGLVMAESGCVSDIESPVGAKGLWQFMPATARAYHLHVKDGIVDERISPPKSTEAAVKFLADLYRKMGSWEFALASYNMGPFGLSARIRRAGGNVSFWDLAAAGLLPEETAKYVPRIQVYALILRNLAHFNFSTTQMRAPDLTSDLEVPPGTRLSQVARAAGTSAAHLRLLNPDIVGATVPDLPGSRFAMQVPKDAVFRARSTLEQLLANGDGADRCVTSAFDWGRQRFTAKMAAQCRASAGGPTAR